MANVHLCFAGACYSCSIGSVLFAAFSPILLDAYEFTQVFQRRLVDPLMSVPRVVTSAGLELL
jgi:hypothetical protein